MVAVTFAQKLLDEISNNLFGVYSFSALNEVQKDAINNVISGMILLSNDSSHIPAIAHAIAQRYRENLYATARR